MTFKSPEFKTQDCELLDIAVSSGNEDLREYVRELAPEFDAFPIQYESALDYVKEFLEIYSLEKVSPVEGKDEEHLFVTFVRGPKNNPEEMICLNYRKKK